MEIPSSPSRRSYDFPKPETGLAEWTSKIKALQRQVDADEEAEQKRLEDEIAASRLARLRRSRANSRADSPDLSYRSTFANDTSSLSDRRKYQDKMTEDKDQFKPALSSKTILSRSASEKPEPISLAAFMGGRATGPRLNRHVPQQDAHDLSQFDQPNITAPHPIFGRGGVAMPGLALKKSTSSHNLNPDSDAVERYQPSYLKRTPNTPSITQKYIDTVEESGVRKNGNSSATVSVARDYERKISESERPASPEKMSTRARTISTSAVRRPANSFAEQSPVQSLLKPSDRRERTLSTPSFSDSTADTTSLLPSITSRPNPRIPLPNTSKSAIPVDERVGPRTGNRPSFEARPVTPQQASHPSENVNSSPHKIPIYTPSLARPIQPEPRLSPHAPAIPPSVVPSPAFKKPVAQKELTPSISRLQGRGFVQNMVRISSSLENSPESSSQSPPLDRSGSAGGRKSSVLDRWQSHTAANSSPTPSMSSQPTQIRRSITASPSIVKHQFDSPSPKINEPAITLKSKTSLSSLAKSSSASSPAVSTRSLRSDHSSTDTSGLGSATTMMLIKPQKSATELSMVDELGIKRSGTPPLETPKRDPTHLPASPGKPLIHPTKDRARKPRRDPSHNKATSRREKYGQYQENPLIEPEASSSPSVIGETTRSEPFNSSSKVVRLAEQWANTAPITPRNTPSRLPTETEYRPPSMVRKALPGMTATKEPTTDDTRSSYREEPPLSPVVPSSPGKPSRIPSTGNRATVMDVAQALSEQAPGLADVRGSGMSETSKDPIRPGILSSAPRIDKRKSSSEKYSSMSLPTLKEEATPTVTPAGTLSRSSDNIQKDLQAKDVTPPRDLSRNTSTRPVNIIHIGHDDVPIPQINIDVISRTRNATPPPPDMDLQTISVDVMTITGTTATSLPQNTDTFYESELLVIIHRTKSKSSGLASTMVWAWRGKNSHMGEREERKVQELAKRYGTSPIIVPQYAEPVQLVHVVGGQLKIRQGSRARWSSENTTMSLVRSLGGVIFIDEHDLSIKNLCSAFSYCITILDAVYVWHGCGATALERQAALWYAQSLVSKGASPVELRERENDDDELFWMILGDEEFAKADYWRWRKTSSLTDPSVWRVDAGLGNDSIIPVQLLSQEKSIHKSVYIIDCVWELFVLVGREARGRRQDIKLALDVAMKLSKRIASARPYTPTVHVIVLPSRLPLDLQMNVRDLNEAFLNDNDVPDHMNLLSSGEASEHLQRRSWERDFLKDQRMLPLGVDVSDATR